MEGALHLDVNDSISPAILPPRHDPVILKGRLKEVLAHLGKATDVIKPMVGVSSLIVTEKPNGKLCASTLNNSTKPLK